ncbi:NAD(P)/FAD-dependent oxidoreductase [Paenibacillus abyssi]|uniref:FAD-dependent oxidoreductase n=1 Tax=Paenibacillus abyssi TaxID=1340531 RepID=A0A917D7B1_9BACL|nr:NAD(P)/FAD-dependent oxidoreductase [Paenibacillus abyssi]GGG13526.1 FAD-dependent oxidoreductase [Paenibacillus abyssi]
MNHNLDAVVIGAGIAGGSLAKALADKGWGTLLIDRQAFPRHKVCGEFISPEAQGMLNGFGLRDPVEALLPSSINYVRLRFSEGEDLEIPLPGTALGVSRYVLDPMLHNAAVSSGVQLLAGTTVTSVSSGDEGYHIVTKRHSGIQTFKARAVIAAWGANPRSGFRDDRRHSARNAYMGVKSHFSGIDMQPAVELYFFSGGYLGISPVEGGHFNVAALLKQQAFKNSGKTILSMIDGAARRNPKLYDRLAQAVPIPGTQAATAPVNLSRKPAAWGLLPHVGDAALMIPPLCGDGMSMALRSSQLCAAYADSYLRGQISLSQWKQGYSRSIVREFSAPLRWGSLLQRLSGVPVLPRLLLSLARLSPGLAAGLIRATRLKDSD